MKIEKKPVSFHWRNYTKPTPRNLKMFMEFWKGIFLILTTGSILNDNNKWVSITIAITGYAIDRAIKFFAYVEEQESRFEREEQPKEVNEEVA